ncbi:MAG: hypothetical protein WCK98_08000 [bacterium]
MNDFLVGLERSRKERKDRFVGILSTNKTTSTSSQGDLKGLYIGFYYI